MLPKLSGLGIPRSSTICATSGMITTANIRHTSRAPAVTALHKIQSCSCITRQLGIWTAAHLACDVTNDIFPQQALNVLGNVLSTNKETLVSVDRTLRTQFGHEELEHMLRGALHHGADFLVVDPERLLGAHTRQLGRLHRAALLLDQVGILRVQDPHHAVEHILVGVVRLAVVFVRFLPVSSLELGD